MIFLEWILTSLEENGHSDPSSFGEHVRMLLSLTGVRKSWVPIQKMNTFLTIALY